MQRRERIVCVTWRRCTATNGCGVPTVVYRTVSRPARTEREYGVLPELAGCA